MSSSTYVPFANDIRVVKTNDIIYCGRFNPPALTPLATLTL